MLWDRGTWQPESPDVDASLQAGEIKFTLYGKKLQGSWVLVRTRGFGSNPARSTWLLIKHRDQYASTKDVTQDEPRSVASQRLLAEIARDGGGDVERASKGDPAGKGRRATSAKPAPGRIGRKKRAVMTDRIPFRVQPMLATLVSLSPSTSRVGSTKRNTTAFGSSPIRKGPASAFCPETARTAPRHTRTSRPPSPSFPIARCSSMAR